MREGRRHPAEWLALLGGVSLALFAGCRPAPSEPPKLATPEARFSYSVGAKLGGELRASSHSIDHDALVRGVEDGLANRVTLSDDELTRALQEGVASEVERQSALLAEQAKEREAQGRELLAANGARPGVVSLDGGVQYEVLQAGTGPVPGVEDFVTCHYRGSLLDGSVFDDTAKLGRPRTFAVTSVVEGLERALLRMPVGSRWKIWVPPDLGARVSRPGSKVPPHSTLIFEVELLSIGRGPAD